MGLRMKILSGFLILTMMLLIAGIWSIYELRTVGRSVQGLLDDNYRSINAANMMMEALEREDSAVLLLLSGKWEKGRSIIRSADLLFQQGLKIARDNVTIPGEQDCIQTLQTRYKAYKGLWLKPIVGTKYEGNLTWYFEEVHKAFLDLKDTIERLMVLNHRTMYKTASDLKNRAYRATMPGIVAILSALVFTLIFNYFINYYMVSPIIRITKGIQRFIETRAPFSIDIETKDELFYLASSIRQLVARIGSGEKEL
jgi:HAMP domain-containing protein